MLPGVTGRTWVKLLRNAFGAGAVLVAAQVGVGSGLTVLNWEVNLTAVSNWGQLLTWLAFIFAIGVAGGSVLGRRLLRQPRPELRLPARLATGFAAALGAALAFPLVWIPVRVSTPAIDAHPELTLAITAGAGSLVGLVLAVFALRWSTAGAGILASAVWVWLFAIISVGLAAKDHVRLIPQLGMVDAPPLIPTNVWWSGPYLMVGIAAVLGVIVAARAGWTGAGWFGVSVSGLAGPATVASAYLVTGWGVSGHGEDISLYLASLAALGVGFAVAAAVASSVVPHRPVRALARPTTVRPAIATVPAPLAIAAEPAFVLQTPKSEPPYQREPGFYTEPIYFAEPRALPAGRPSPTVGKKPAAPRKPASAKKPNLAPRPEPAPAPQPKPLRQPEPTPVPMLEALEEPTYDAGHATPVEAVVVAPVEVPVQAEVVVEPPPSVSTRDKGKRRRTGGDKNKNRLRKGERDHIDWIDNLVQLPVDPDLKLSKER
jgi:hypothetical protein